MEEPKPAKEPLPPNPNPGPTTQSPSPDLSNTATAPPPSPPQPPLVAPSQTANGKKRPRERLEDWSYYKMRALVREMRPLVLEVLRTPDFQNCKGAHEIKQKLKLIVELCKQMSAETDTATKHVKDDRPLPAENGVEKRPQEQVQQSQPEKVFTEPAENKPSASGSSVVNEKLVVDDSENQGTYIVGGSAFGWNFITYLGSKPIYYGRTKESFRTSQLTS